MKFIKILLSLSIFSFLLSTAALAKDYTRYVDADLKDVYSASQTPDCQNYDPSKATCSGGSQSAFSTSADVNSFIKSLQSGDTAKIYFQRGDTWVMNKADDYIQIRTSGVKVTLDAFGNGNPPVFDGLYNGGNYDADSRFLVNLVAQGQTIKNLTFKNSYSHAVMVSSGTDHLISNCRFVGIGSAAVSISSDTGGILQYNYTNDTQKRWRVGADGTGTLGGWPQAFNMNVGSSSKWTIQYNYVSNAYGEGIGVGSSIVQYNVVTNFRTVGVYMGGRGPGIARYNLVIGTQNPTYSRQFTNNRYWSGSGIVINHENNSKDVDDDQVYGNIVINCLYGVRFKNAGSSDDALTIENVKVHDNMFIDNLVNVTRENIDKYKNLIFKDNWIIAYDGDSSNQVSTFGTTPNSTCTIGPNYWNVAPKGGYLFESGFDSVFDPNLAKRSGWYLVSGLESFEMSDLVPTTPIRSTSTSLSAIVTTSSSSYSFIDVGSGYQTIPDLKNFSGLGQSDGADGNVDSVSPPVLKIVNK